MPAVAGGDNYESKVLDAAEDQIFDSNSSILATLANISAIAVSADPYADKLTWLQ